jgi:hypothetical protein
MMPERKRSIPPLKCELRVALVSAPAIIIGHPSVFSHRTISLSGMNG